MALVSEWACRLCLSGRGVCASVGLVLECDGELDVPHGGRMEGMVTADGYVTYVCEAGYTMHINPASNDNYVKAATVRCGANGEWHINNMACLRTSLLYFIFWGKTAFDAYCDQKMGPTLADLQKHEPIQKMGAIGPLGFAYFHRWPRRYRGVSRSKLRRTPSKHTAV